MTKKRDTGPPSDPGLRLRAEERLAEREAPMQAPSESDAARLVHELQVHQIELEMQNEELRRSQAAAESALALYSELYDFAPVGYLTLGPEGTIRRANLAGAKLLGMERARLVDKRLGAFLASASLPEFNGALTSALAGEVPPSCEIALASSRDDAGGATWVQLTLSAGGDGARAVAVDITDRKRAEDTLRNSQKMEAIGRLAGGVAHDFNNLLTIILGGVEAVRIAVDDGASPHDELLLLTNAAQRAAALTGKLLAFGQKQLLRPEIVDVNGLTLGLTNLLRTVLGERIELVMQLTPHPGWTEVDPVQLEQVLVNLVVNGHDAMLDGGRLTVTTANVNVGTGAGAGAVKPGSYVVLTVSDTGVGMDRETVAHIFEPFFTTKSRGQGAGLGLASVAGIVEQCGGQIAVRSELGKGTTFEIYLRASAPTAVVSAPDPSVSPRGGTETILVVDDEEPLRRIGKRVLEAAGYTVLLAGSGAEALELLGRHAGTVHLLVSDVIMPGMTGQMLARRVGEARPGTKILLTSGYADGLLGNEGVLDQSTCFLGKPYTAADLRTKVRDVLDAPTRRQD